MMRLLNRSTPLLHARHARAIAGAEPAITVQRCAAPRRLLSTGDFDGAVAGTLRKFGVQRVRPWLAQALAAKGFSQPSAIQAAAMPLIARHANAVLHAETGSGKTLAYMVPLISRAPRPRDMEDTRECVLTPCRCPSSCMREFGWVARGVPQAARVGLLVQLYGALRTTRLCHWRMPALRSAHLLCAPSSSAVGQSGCACGLPAVPPLHQVDRNFPLPGIFETSEVSRTFLLISLKKIGVLFFKSEKKEYTEFFSDL